MWYRNVEQIAFGWLKGRLLLAVIFIMTNWEDAAAQCVEGGQVLSCISDDNLLHITENEEEALNTLYHLMIERGIRFPSLVQLRKGGFVGQY